MWFPAGTQRDVAGRFITHLRLEYRPVFSSVERRGNGTLNEAQFTQMRVFTPHPPTPPANPDIVPFVITQERLPPRQRLVTRFISKQKTSEGFNSMQGFNNTHLTLLRVRLIGALILQLHEGDIVMFARSGRQWKLTKIRLVFLHTKLQSSCETLPLLLRGNSISSSGGGAEGAGTS